MATVGTVVSDFVACRQAKVIAHDATKDPVQREERKAHEVGAVQELFEHREAKPDGRSHEGVFVDVASSLAQEQRRN